MRILFITPDTLTDIAFAMPLLDRLYHAFAHGVFDIVTPKKYMELFASFPNLAVIGTLPSRIHVNARLENLAHYRHHHYDMIFDLSHRQLARALRYRQFIQRPYRLSQNLPRSESYLNLWPSASRAVGKFWLPERMQTAAAERVVNIIKSKKNQDIFPCIGLAPWASTPKRRYPLSYWAQVLQALKQHYPTATFVAVGPTAAHRALTKLQTHYNVHVPYLSTHTTVSEALALLQNTHFVLGGDSGLGHAVSLQTPTLLLAGSRNTVAYHPIGQGNAVITPTNHLCDIPPATIISETLKILAHQASQTKPAMK